MPLYVQLKFQWLPFPGLNSICPVVPIPVLSLTAPKGRLSGDICHLDSHPVRVMPYGMFCALVCSVVISSRRHAMTGYFIVLLRCISVC